MSKNKPSVPGDPGPAMQVKCEEHHWVNTHQPDFPVYWITQCSICGRYDADRMVEEIQKWLHRPFTDDGVTYCGLDGHEGCGEVWPCSTIRALGVSS